MVCSTSNFRKYIYITIHVHQKSFEQIEETFKNFKRPDSVYINPHRLIIVIRRALRLFVWGDRTPQSRPFFDGVVRARPTLVQFSLWLTIAMCSVLVGPETVNNIYYLRVPQNMHVQARRVGKSLAAAGILRHTYY